MSVVDEQWVGFNDNRTYRTELWNRKPGWSLSVDSQHVADTSEALPPRQATDWARRQLGEGVEFLPGNERGDYWVANPEQTRREASR